MLSTWLTLRQAREALRAGQPGEARRLAAPLAAEGYRKAIRIVRDVGRFHVARGEKHLRADDAAAAWRELLAAEAVNPAADGAVRLRHTLTRLGLAECRAALEAGSPTHVLDVAARLRDRGVGSPELTVLADAAAAWVQADDQAARGDFSLAVATLTRVRDGLDPLSAAGPARSLDEVQKRHEAFRAATDRLHAAADAGQWDAAVWAADAAVAAAPNHRETRSLRAKAWAALRPPAGRDSVPIPLAVALAADDPPAAEPGTRTYVPLSSVSMDTPAALPKRFLLWVDGVGGYLVCLGPRVTFGHATPQTPVDVPLFADVSRLHAEVSRDAEGYVLESGREVQVNGVPAKRSPLAAGDRLTLGPTCQFVFRKPVPISPTAALELVSGHRLPLAVDGVLLMAESLILGRPGRSHIPLPDEVPGNVVLYRSKDGLGVKCDGPFTVDGRPCAGRSPLPLPSVVAAEAFTFAVEPVGPRL